jgi:hypothetical protein
MSIRSDIADDESSFDTFGKDKPDGSSNSSSLFISQFKTDTYQSYSLCEHKNFTTTCFMVPIYVVRGKYY